MPLDVTEYAPRQCIGKFKSTIATITRVCVIIPLDVPQPDSLSRVSRRCVHKTNCTHASLVVYMGLLARHGRRPMGFLIGSHWKYRPQRSHHHSQPFKALDQSCWRQGNIEELVWADTRDDAEPQIFAATKLLFSSEYSVQSLIGQPRSRLSKKIQG